MISKTTTVVSYYSDIDSKNDSPNKLIIVKKSRQTDQNDKSCKKKFDLSF